MIKSRIARTIRGLACVAAISVSLGLTACSAPKEEGGGANTSQAVGKAIPAYYPSDYGDIVARAEKEGRLLVYSNVAEYNWRYILEEFEKRHPTIQVESIDIGPAEAFERYYAESSADKRTADLIVVAAPDAWLRFIKADQVLEYESPEADKVPDWSKPSPGLYTVATDPMILIYNKMLLESSEYPNRVTDLMRQVNQNSAKWKKKLATYDAASHPFAYTLQWTAVQRNGWDYLEALAPYTRPEAGGSNMLDKVMAGEYLGAFYTSGITVFPKMKDKGRDQIIGWAVPQDGVPVMMRGLAVTKNASSPNAAKLLLDFMISHDGQVAAGRGGMTPYRPDVTPEEVPYLTYSELEKEAGGREKMMMIDYNPQMLADYEAFVSRWNSLFPPEQ